MATKKTRGRGRPATFKTLNERRHVAKLVAEHGATETVNILKAEAKAKKIRGFSVTIPTVCNVAKDLGVKLTRGRRAAA
jgi:hypothetical protein